MKIFMTLLMVIMIGSFAIAQKLQEKDVPANVKLAFQKQYPKITKVKWKKEENNYEVEFKDKEEVSVLISSSGDILETEIEIEANQLPKGVAEYVKANYKSQSIKEAAKIADSKGIITYEAEIKGKDLIFDSAGKFIKESKD